MSLFVLCLISLAGPVLPGSTNDEPKEDLDPGDPTPEPRPVPEPTPSPGPAPRPLPPCIPDWDGDCPTL